MQGKTDVQFRLVSITSDADISMVNPVIVKCERGKKFKETTSSFNINEIVNKTFSFKSTFEQTKGGYKKKSLKLEIVSTSIKNLKSDKLTIDLADYVNDSNKVKTFERRVSFNCTPIVVKCQVLFGGGLFPTVVETKKESKRPISYNAKRVSRNGGVIMTITTKQEHTNAKPVAAEDDLDIGRIKANVTTASSRVNTHRRNQSSTEGLSQRNKTLLAEAQKNKLTVSTTIYRNSLNMASLSNFTKSNPQIKKCRSLRSSMIVQLDEVGEKLIEDVKTYSSFMDMEQSSDNKINNILVEIIIRSLPHDEFIDNPMLAQGVANELKDLAKNELISFRQTMYLFCCIVRLIIIYTQNNRKERVEPVSQFIQQLMTLLPVCYDKTMKLIALRFNKLWNESLENNCDAKLLVEEMKSFNKMLTDFHLLQPLKSMVYKDFYRIINITFCDNVTKGYCTDNNSIQFQILISSLVECQMMNKIPNDRDNFLLIQEVSHVLLLKDKEILLDEARLDCCPHLKEDVLIGILENYDSLNPNTIKSGTISLIKRHMSEQRIEFYDYSIPDGKDMNWKDELNCCIDCVCTNYDLTTTPLATRPYLK